MAKSKKNRALARTRARTAAREAKAIARLRDVGPDHGGNYGPNPYAVKGRTVEVAPKDLGKELPKDSAFPKRIVGLIDWYKARHHIAEREAKAADTLAQFWTDAGLEAKVTSGYDPVMVQSSPNMDGRIAKRVDGVRRLGELMQDIPYHCRGVVMAVVIEGRTAADWAQGRGLGQRDSGPHGLRRLRCGLQALARSLRY